jgi:hypothetical protein
MQLCRACRLYLALEYADIARFTKSLVITRVVARIFEWERFVAALWGEDKNNQIRNHHSIGSTKKQYECRVQGMCDRRSVRCAMGAGSGVARPEGRR